MRVDAFFADESGRAEKKPKSAVAVVRLEIPIVHQTEEQYKVIVLDAEDTLDVIIHFPDGERECVWSLVK